ncbi:Chromate transport protein [Granulibacter bethesdensis]|nr:Chromate transport protein [Granulibacter bethesdensis]
MSGCIMSQDDAISPIERPSLWRIAMTFNQIALLGFGGGLSAWSRDVLVLRRRWLSEETFLSALTVARVLPGANQVNLAVFVGTRLRGVCGAMAAIAGLVMVPFLIILALSVGYLEFQHALWLQHVLAGLAAGAVGLTFSMAWQTGRKVLTAPAPALIFAASVLLSAVIRMSLLWMLLILLPVSFVWAWLTTEKDRKG